MDRTVLAYLAGAMDSDGHFGIKRSTYHIRVRCDAHNAVYSERCGMKQVTPQIPTLLKECFGGNLHLAKAPAENRKPLYTWNATARVASACCRALLPYLRVKRRQADVVLELTESRTTVYLHEGYWFAREFPDWQKMDLLTYQEVGLLLGYTNPRSVGQAVKNGCLLAIPREKAGAEAHRVPALLVERLLGNLGKDHRARRQPAALVAWRDSLCEQVRELNKVGVHGTPTYHRTGCYAPL